jgi:hypothetical protein
MNAMWPVKEFLNAFFVSILGGAKLIKDFEQKINIEQLEKILREKSHLEVFNIDLHPENFNKLYLPLTFPFEFTSLKIGKVYLRFPMTFMKDKIEIVIEDIDVVIKPRNFENFDINYFSELDSDTNIKKEKFNIMEYIKKSIPAPIIKILNTAINNLDISLKNLSITIEDENISSPSKSNKIKILVGGIFYSKFQESPKDTLFIFNKQIKIQNFLIKIEEKASGEENSLNKSAIAPEPEFFSLIRENKEKELIEFYTNENCILISSLSDNKDKFSLSTNNIPPSCSCDNYTSLILKFEKDAIDKEKLKISIKLDKLESILTTHQLNFLLKFSNKILETVKKIQSIQYKYRTNFNKESIFDLIYSQTQIEFLTFKISHINLNLEISNINFILIEPDLIKSTSFKNYPKIWLMYENFYKKYYLDESCQSNLNFDLSKIENIQKHFSYLEENFFIFNISEHCLDFNLDLLKNEKNAKLSFKKLESNYVEPNNIPFKKDLIVINNIITNEIEKFFDRKFSKLFINSLKYGLYTFDILTIKKIEINFVDKFSNCNLADMCRSITMKIDLEEIFYNFNFFILLKILQLTTFIEKSEKIKNEHDQIQIEIKNRTPISENNNFKNLKLDNINISPINNPLEMNNSLILSPNNFKKTKIDFGSSKPESTENSEIFLNQNKNKEEKIIPNNSPNPSKPPQPEIKILINFNLNLKITALPNESLMYKDFYSSNIQNLYQKKTDFTSLAHTQENSFPFKGHKENSWFTNEFILLRIKSNQIIFHQKSSNNSSENNFDILIDFNKFFLFYQMNKIYFPIIQYTQNSFTIIDEVDLYEIEKLKSSKSWVSIINYKNLSRKEYQENLMRESIFYLNSHHIKKNENFILDEVNKRKFSNKFLVDLSGENYQEGDLNENQKFSHANEENQIIIQFLFKKFDIFINYIYLNHLIDYLQVFYYNMNYFTIFTSLIFSKNFNEKCQNNEIIEKFPNEQKNNQKFFENLRYTINLEIKEINIIGFSNLNLNLFESPLKFLKLKINLDSEDLNIETMQDYFLLETYLTHPENIFNIIENPFFKIHISHLNTTLINYNQEKYFTINSLDNLKILIRKNENIFQEAKIKHQIFLQGIYEEENFEHFLYKGNSNFSTKRNLVSTLLKFEIKHKNSFSKFLSSLDPLEMNELINKCFTFYNENNEYKLELLSHIDDFIICPLFNNLEESLRIFEEIRKDYLRYKVIIRNNFEGEYEKCDSNVRNFHKNLIKKELLINQKIFNQNFELEKKSQNIQLHDVYSHNSEISNLKNNKKIDLTINLQISRILIDLFSYYKKQQNSHEIKENELKHKMRLILEIESILYEEIKRDSMNDKFSKLSGLSSSYYPRILNFSIGRINTVFLRNLDYKNSQSLLSNKCQNISKENSHWRKIGFTEIFNLENLQIGLSELNNNFKTDFTISSIEFAFCKDSLKYFLLFLNKSKRDMIFISSEIFNIFKDKHYDKDSVITELEMIQEKTVNDQLGFPSSHKERDHSIEFRKVKGKALQIKNNNIQTFGTGAEIFYDENFVEKIEKKNHKNISVTNHAFTHQILKINQKKISTNTNNNIQEILPYPYQQQKVDNLFVLDNPDKRSVSAERPRKNNYLENFHSSAQEENLNLENENFILDAKEAKENRISLPNYNCDTHTINSQCSSEKEIASQIVEKLNLFFAIHNFKIYLFEGKDFNFIDMYDVSFSRTKFEKEKEKEFDSFSTGNKNNFSDGNFNNNSIPELRKNELEFSVTINTHPAMIKYIDDYLENNNFFSSQIYKNENETNNNSRIYNNRSNKDNTFKQDFRLRGRQRDYSSYLLLDISQIEAKFYYYSNSPMIFSHLLEIRTLHINDFIKDSKFKKLLSNYSFEDHSGMFLTLKLDLFNRLNSSFNKDKEKEICLYLQLSSLNILVDQICLKFILRFFKFKFDTFNSSADETETENNESGLLHNTSVSQINRDTLQFNENLSQSSKSHQPSQSIPLTQHVSEIIHKDNKFFAKRLIVQEFFINFCYNSHNLKIENLKDKKIFDYLNFSNINDLKLGFKSYNFNDNKMLVQAFEEIFEFWKKDILKGQIVNAYLSSISFIRPFKNIVVGFLEIFKQPYNSYIQDRSIQEGLANGVKNFVVSFSTEALTVGERVRKFFFN